LALFLFVFLINNISSTSNTKEKETGENKRIQGNLCEVLLHRISQNDLTDALLSEFLLLHTMLHAERNKERRMKGEK
jgi:hypothetical protein